MGATQRSVRVAGAWALGVFSALGLGFSLLWVLAVLLGGATDYPPSPGWPSIVTWDIGRVMSLVLAGLLALLLLWLGTRASRAVGALMALCDLLVLAAIVADRFYSPVGSAFTMMDVIGLLILGALPVLILLPAITGIFVAVRCLRDTRLAAALPGPPEP